MLAFLVLLTFLFGITCGIILTVTIAVNSDVRDDRKMRKIVANEPRVFIENGPKHFTPDILKD